MPQLFGPAANTIAKASLALGGLAPVLIFGIGSQLSRSPYNTNQFVSLDQPVPFSHKHHVGELGLDCRFCHPNATRSNFVDIPATEICMTCHSQIWTNSPLLQPVRDSYASGTPIKFKNGDPGWNQVHKLPEFVYFDHSIHIDRGISCNVCHGDIADETLTRKNIVFSMAWCLNCHRNPEKYLYEDDAHKDETPQEKVFNLYRKAQEADDVTPRERAILKGDGIKYQPDKAELAKGLELLERYKIKKAQLADCWVCHR